ncbi:MAG: NADH-quinone oxidoreductase subunit N [Deltaproteobacteria bacterium]|nr:NADH-quinone oxidoreductase subunit N [Deltaproteobacteria bacterium]
MLFLPETFLLFMALLFFCQSMWKSSADLNQGLALFLSALLVILSLVSLNASGDLFYKAYRVDLFSQTFKGLISLGLFLVVLLGRKIKSIEERLQPEFFMFLSLSTLGLMLMVSSVELLTIFIAMELSSYSIYVLIPIRNQPGGNQMEAAIKYIIFGAAATGVMLFGMSYIFGVSQSTYLVDILQKMPILIKEPIAVIGLLMVLCGFFFKLAVVPFHFWTPDIYQGAANETVSFVATMPKLAGLALLLRLVSLAGSGAVDLIQLAYSSIAHAGYVLLGVLAVNAAGFSAALFHITAYLLMNLACFLVICTISRQGENITISDLSGLYKRSPLLAFTLAVGAFALAGIPPTAGFTGKLYLFIAALDQGHLALVIIAAVNTAISIYYYLNIVRSAYGQDPNGSPAVTLSFSNRLLNFGLILAILLMGTLPAWFINLARTACKTLVS